MYTEETLLIYREVTRYIFHGISLKSIKQLAYILSYYRIIIQRITALNLSVDDTLRNLVLPSFQVGQGSGYAVYAKQPTLQRK